MPISQPASALLLHIHPSYYRACSEPLSDMVELAEQIRFAGGVVEQVGLLISRNKIAEPREV